MQINHWHCYSSTKAAAGAKYFTSALLILVDLEPFKHLIKWKRFQSVNWCTRVPPPASSPSASIWVRGNVYIGHSSYFWFSDLHPRNLGTQQSRQQLSPSPSCRIICIFSCVIMNSFKQFLLLHRLLTPIGDLCCSFHFLLIRWIPWSLAHCVRRDQAKNTGIGR